MSAYVRFRAADADYAVPIEHALEVQPAGTIASLPSPGAGVVGVAQRNGEPLTIVSMFPSTGKHVLVLVESGRPFGLLVDEVLGVTNAPESEVAEPPRGQKDAVITGVINAPERSILIVDVGQVARSFSS